MATLYVSWFKGASNGIAHGPLKSETVSTSGTSAASGAAPPKARVVAVRSDAAHYVTLGESLTAAAANSVYVAANETREFNVASGAGLKISAITV